MRIIFLNRNRKIIAPVLGFFEVLIWIVAVSSVMRNLSNPVVYLAYGGGFAMGNFVGMKIEERVAAGLLAVRAIMAQDAAALIESLRVHGFGVTRLLGQGADGPVNVIFMVIRRKHLPEVVRQLQEQAPGAFYTVEEVRSASGGTYPTVGPAWRGLLFNRFRGQDER